MSLRRSPWRWLLALVILNGAVQAQTATQESVDSLPPSIPELWQDAFNRLVFYGDFRYRLEGDWDRPGNPDRWRSRLRVRLGANYSVKDNLLVGTRLTTGAKNDPRDSNETVGGGFSKIELNLDRLFLTWNPDDAHTSFVTLGKFGHPFQRNPINEELVWYSDVQAEGVMLGKTIRDVGVVDRLRGQAGYYIFSERNQDDIRIAVAELLASSRLNKTTLGNFSVAWYGYENPANNPAATVPHYQIVDAIVGITTTLAGAPWRFSAEGISNLSASGRDANGWALGLSCGAAKERGDWRAYYQYQVIGNDAVFVPVAGADFLIDHNFRGHVINVDYVISRDVTLRTRLLTSTPIDPALLGGVSDTAYRLRIDLNVKF